jgi:hypothetical protein
MLLFLFLWSLRSYFDFWERQIDDYSPLLVMMISVEKITADDRLRCSSRYKFTGVTFFPSFVVEGVYYEKVRGRMFVNRRLS